MNSRTIQIFIHMVLSGSKARLRGADQESGSRKLLCSKEFVQSAVS